MNFEDIWARLDIPSHFQSHKYSDISFCCPEGVFKSHRLVVGAACALLKHCLLDDQVQLADDSIILMPDYSKTEIEEFIMILYGCHKSLDTIQESVKDLLKDVGFLQSDSEAKKVGLQSQCSDVKIECDVLDDDLFDLHEDDDSDVYDPDQPPAKRGRGRPPGPGLRYSLNDQGVYGCKDPDCDFMTPSQVEIKSHVEFHVSENVVCDQCSKLVPKSSLARHMARKHKVNKTACPHCGQVMVAQYLARHVAKKHGNVREFECMECSTCFATSVKLDEHVQRLHSDMGSRCRKCTYCGKKFGSLERLEEHEFQCMPIELPQKDKCKFGSKRKRAPTANIKVPINEEHPDQCPYEGCAYSNPKSGRVRNHYLTKHCRQRCPYCNKILSALHMERHVMMDHTKDYNFVCDKCSKGFFKQRDLTNHIDEEHVKELKHVCDLCGKAFFSAGKLYAHKYRAHIRNDWRCDPCGKKYTNQGSLIKHLKRYHNGEGIDKLFKDENGLFRQVRNYRHIPEKADALDKLILDESTLEPYLGASSSKDDEAVSSNLEST